MTSTTTATDREEGPPAPTAGAASATLGLPAAPPRPSGWGDAPPASGAAGRCRAAGRAGTPLTTAADWFLWVLSLSAFWAVFTLAGGVLLGVAPASVAAATLVRERVLGRRDRIWRDGARIWARGFLASQLAVFPLVFVTVTLAANYLWFSALGPGATGGRLLTLAGFALAGTALAWAAPLAAHYTVPPWRVTPLATRLVLARPASSVLLAFTALGLSYAVAAVPVLGAVAIGGWWAASTCLCLRFFADNEERRTEPRAAAPALALPTQPLSTR
ncbi:DUF624 domain-containing protein [Streptomyces sp. DSM 44915]|uniref:DUF624 domain-containing protein n=1 Tax=Streptomyces chisholmiae TaxID=3075540 RepID=A0ABU2JWD3_9ACTN|nr:DUF624 domain-containing protein [Streptomyces sp. DSM 44915]MDT0269046.1 DUF624 domain-containing protein [Streptomyces sp. DSM 44915]